MTYRQCKKEREMIYGSHEREKERRECQCDRETEMRDGVHEREKERREH